MNSVIIHPHLIRQFGPTEGSTFCLISNPEIIDHFKIEENDAYVSYMSVKFNCGDSFDAMVEQGIPESAHILVISPDCLFESPSPEKIGPRRKLLAMPYNPTLAPLDAIARFIDTIEGLNPEVAQDKSVEVISGSAQPQAKRGVMQRKKSSSCPCQY